MKRGLKIAALGLALGLILVSGAQALFVCDVCRPWTQGLCLNLECPQVPSHTTCDVYLAAGCPTFGFLLPAKEQFLLSLEAQAAAEQPLESHPQPLL
jgi:hypothetical protein